MFLALLKIFNLLDTLKSPEQLVHSCGPQRIWLLAWFLRIAHFLTLAWPQAVLIVASLRHCLQWRFTMRWGLAMTLPLALSGKQNNSLQHLAWLLCVVCNNPCIIVSLAQVIPCLEVHPMWMPWVYQPHLYYLRICQSAFMWGTVISYYAWTFHFCYTN